ncbi:MAG: hypothetical protein KF723_18370 [Rhizobiaceae bacterium]|nr:hypothetical protein [Rhizobiaceae bacterium]
MAMKRTREPWMKADAFGRSLPRGIGLNLLVPDVAPLAAFCETVLGARIIHADEDFAAVELLGSVFMLHADHAYADHEMSGVVAGQEFRGAGLEIRVYGLDPDAVEARAREANHVVLAGAVDKPHGLRESYVVAPGGYVFVPSLILAA